MYPITQEEKESLDLLLQSIQKAFAKDYINQESNRRSYNPLKIKEYSNILSISRYVLLFSYIKNVTSMCICELFTSKELIDLIDCDNSNRIEGLYKIISQIKINDIDVEYCLPSQFNIFTQDVDISKKTISSFISSQIKFLQGKENLIDVAFLPIKAVNTVGLIKPELEKLFD